MLEYADAIDRELVRFDHALAGVVGVPLLIFPDMRNALTARLLSFQLSFHLFIVAGIVFVFVDVDIQLRISGLGIDVVEGGGLF